MAASDWSVVHIGVFCWKSTHLIWWSVIGGLLASENLEIVAVLICVCFTNGDLVGYWCSAAG